MELDEALQDFGIIDESLWPSESSWIPRAKGRPIPTNDVWIAAHAMENGADPVSAVCHFESVAGIAWLWLDNQ